jgi:adenine-specific DNA methylase
MFSHHILKPERTPLEANLWGTEKSSGSFSTLFHSRILRAAEYAYKPYEIRVGSNGEAVKLYGISRPITGELASSYAEFEGKDLYLSCGPSQKTDIASNSVDLVVTDPPFFDNVYYSELADFFHAWQRLLRDEDLPDTTRSPAEVQNGHVISFTSALGSVWKECFRVLKRDGLLAFTYHHSRQEGWSALLQSLKQSGFVITAVHPIRSEMSVATPKAQSRQPINIDIIIVCRKRKTKKLSNAASGDLVEESLQAANDQIHRFNRAGRHLGKGDARVILFAQMLKRLSEDEGRVEDFQQSMYTLESGAEQLFAMQPNA